MARLELLLCAAFLTACGPAGSGTHTASAPASGASTLRCFRVHSPYPIHDGDLITTAPVAGIDDGTLYCLGPDRYFVKPTGSPWNAIAVRWKKGRSIHAAGDDPHAGTFLESEAFTSLDFIPLSAEPPAPVPAPSEAGELATICAKDPCSCWMPPDTFGSGYTNCPLRFSTETSPDSVGEAKWSVRLVRLPRAEAIRARREIARLDSPEHVCAEARAKAPEQLWSSLPQLRDLDSCRAALRIVEQFRSIGRVGEGVFHCSRPEKTICSWASPPG